MRRTKSFNTAVDCKDKRIIIYGAGRYGKLAYYGLKALGCKPYAFVDRSREKKEFLGLEVFEPSSLYQYADDVILIASYNYFYEMLADAQQKGCKYIYDIYDMLQADYDDSCLDEYTKDEKNNIEKYGRLIEDSDGDGLIITHLELVVTECCSLKCRDCANLIQYYDSPENMELGQLTETFDRFLECIDRLLELRILGGEPFVYRDLAYIIEKYSKCKKIDSITIYTNSTIVPNADILNSLKRDNVIVHMSDYGVVSKKVEELAATLKENGVKFYVHKYEEWYDVGCPIYHDYSEDKIKNLFDKCFMSKCYTFYRGKFFLCPRSAHGEQLGYFENNNEFVDFNSSSDTNINRVKIENVIKDVEYLTACKYCNGSIEEMKKVEAAIQR